MHYHLKASKTRLGAWFSPEDNKEHPITLSVDAAWGQQSRYVEFSREEALALAAALIALVELKEPVSAPA